MGHHFDPGALLATSYLLPGGMRVRLRLLAASDAERVRHLLAGAGQEPSDLELLRLTRFDPRRRLVLCATALIDGTDQLVGLGAIELGPRDGEPVPETVAVHPRAPDGLAQLISGALVGRARALARRHAA
jgi:hypothetical protein